MELEKLAQMPEHEIDTSDIPEWTDEMWKRAVRGQFYRPVKKAVSLRLDADVIAWLKKDSKGYFWVSGSRVARMPTHAMRLHEWGTRRSRSPTKSN